MLEKEEELPPAGPVDARVKRSKDLVLAATGELLTETGLGGLSVDEVSRRSGVAKTTIYRHWPNRTSLAMEACSRLGPRAPAPDTGSFFGDLASLIGFVADQLTNARWPTVMPSVVDASEHDPDTAAIHSKLHAGMTGPFRAVVERAQARGEVSTKLPSSVVVSWILGPLFYRRWFSREAIDQVFIEGLIRMVLEAAK